MEPTRSGEEPKEQAVEYLLILIISLAIRRKNNMEKRVESKESKYVDCLKIKVKAPVSLWSRCRDKIMSYVRKHEYKLMAILSIIIGYEIYLIVQIKLK